MKEKGRHFQINKNSDNWLPADLEYKQMLKKFFKLKEKSTRWKLGSSGRKEKHQKKEGIWENGRGHQATIVQDYLQAIVQWQSEDDKSQEREISNRLGWLDKPGLVMGGKWEISCWGNKC